MKKIHTIFPQVTQDTPGYAVRIVRNERVLLEESYGLANLKTKEPISADTPFRLASLTKPFTAMAIMLLYEKKLLTFEDRLKRFFPDFPAYGKEITIRQLLTHTSGIPDHEQPLYRLIKPGEEPTIYDSLEVLKNQSQLLFPSGEQYLYSDAGYVMLALIIEKVSGMKYREFLQKYIFAPLQMMTTYVLDETKPFIPHRAYGYKKRNESYELYDYDPLNYILGDEGIYSTVNDLTAWRNAWNSNILINKDTLLQALTPQKLSSGKEGICGFSWFIEKYRKRNILYHDGFWVGFNNIMLTDLVTETTIIILTNSTDFSSTEKKLAIAMDYLEPFL